jgi:hypothetical protein
MMPCVFQKPEVTDDPSEPVPDIGPPTRTQATKRASTSAYGEWETVEKEPEYENFILFFPNSIILLKNVYL